MKERTPCWASRFARRLPGAMVTRFRWWVARRWSRSHDRMKYSNISNKFPFQLVPLTGWLPVPLPSQIRCMTVPGGAITHFEVSPCKQHLIIARKTGDPQLWHIMSNRIIGTFKGKVARPRILAEARISKAKLKCDVVFVDDLNIIYIRKQAKPSELFIKKDFSLSAFIERFDSDNVEDLRRQRFKWKLIEVEVCLSSLWRRQFSPKSQTMALSVMRGGRNGTELAFQVDREWRN